MNMQEVKRGDVRTLRWNLGRDLTLETSARVIIAPAVGETPVLDRNGVIDTPKADGIVSLALETTDYGAGKLEVPEGLELMDYLVEVETMPGPLTHPSTRYGVLRLWADLG